MGLLEGGSGLRRTFHFEAVIATSIEQNIAGGYEALKLHGDAIESALANITVPLLLRAARLAGFPHIQISVLHSGVDELNAPPYAPPSPPAPLPLAPAPRPPPHTAPP